MTVSYNSDFTPRYNTLCLIIIGYGCKDKGINEMIKDNFDYKNKPSFIIDKYAGASVETFAQKINAKIIKESIDRIDKTWFI